MSSLINLLSMDSALSKVSVHRDATHGERSEAPDDIAQQWKAEPGLDEKVSVDTHQRHLPSF